MKKLFLILLLLWSCAVDEVHINEQPEISIKFQFQKKFVNDFNFESLSNARSADLWQHVLSPSSIAIITITNLDNGRSLSNRKKFNQLVDMSLSLSPGNYVIDIEYKAYKHDNGLSFNGTSGPVNITASTTSIMMDCWTDESLVILDKEGIGTRVIPKFSDGSMKTPPNTPYAWMLFETTDFFFIYIQDTVNYYYFQYCDNTPTENLITVKIEKKLRPGDFYMLSLTETGITPVLEYDSLLQSDIFKIK